MSLYEPYVPACDIQDDILGANSFLWADSMVVFWLRYAINFLLLFFGHNIDMTSGSKMVDEALGRTVSPPISHPCTASKPQLEAKHRRCTYSQRVMP